jgi:sugar O-acyltransferase (sialic acid O-acetyltransferase NeuD family)
LSLPGAHSAAPPPPHKPLPHHSSKSQGIVVPSKNDSQGRPAGVTDGNGVTDQAPPLMKDLTPADCDRIIIVGAGGFGREVLQWARHAWPDHAARIAGFLSADPDKLAGHATNLPILGSPEDFKPQPTDGLLLAIGIPRVRRQVAERLEARGARFLALIHPTAIVADTAEIGTGSVICPYAIVSDAVKLGRFVLVNYHASLGHDASAGDFAVFSPYATLGGGARVENEVLMGLHASLAPGVVVSSGAAVAANSCALVDVPEARVVYGVPGRVGQRLDIEDLATR